MCSNLQRVKKFHGLVSTNKINRINWEKTQINKIKVSRTNFIMFHYNKFAKALLVLAYSTTIMNNNGLLCYTAKVNASTLSHK